MQRGGGCGHTELDRIKDYQLGRRSVGDQMATAVTVKTCLSFDVGHFMCPYVTFIPKAKCPALAYTC